MPRNSPRSSCFPRKCDFYLARTQLMENGSEDGKLCTEEGETVAEDGKKEVKCGDSVKDIQM